MRPEERRLRHLRRKRAADDGQSRQQTLNPLVPAPMQSQAISNQNPKVTATYIIAGTDAQLRYDIDNDTDQVLLTVRDLIQNIETKGDDALGKRSLRNHFT